MQFTGEQFIPGITKQRLIDEHYERYVFANALVEGKNVLDIACGTGYGTHMLAESARNVMGVDISEESILFAERSYSKDNVRYKVSSVIDDIFSAQSFDVICSFETIEHLHENERQQYLKNLKKWLRSDGILLLSTPNKRITSPFSKKPLNEFHVLEYTREALDKELSNYFIVQKWYGQRPIKKWKIGYFMRKTINIIQRITRKDFGIFTTASKANVQEYNKRKYEPRIFVLICTKK